jgi:hypothetical protein
MAKQMAKAFNKVNSAAVVSNNTLIKLHPGNSKKVKKVRCVEKCKALFRLI